MAVPLQPACRPTRSRRATLADMGQQRRDQCGAAIPGLGGNGPIPVADQASGNPQKIAKPDAAGLLIAQFYPSPTTGANGTLLSNGNNWAAADQQPPELE